MGYKKGEDMRILHIVIVAIMSLWSISAYAEEVLTKEERARINLKAERLVEDALYSLKKFEQDAKYDTEIKQKYKKAQAVLIFPSVLKGGWFIGAVSYTHLTLPTICSV